MARLEDVKLWCTRNVAGGACCIVGEVDGGWVHTLCGTWGNMSTRTDRPKRICRKCRERLANATRVLEGIEQ